MKHHRTDKCATDGNDTANNAGPDGEINSRWRDGLHEGENTWQTKGVDFRLRVANNGGPQSPTDTGDNKGVLTRQVDAIYRWFGDTKQTRQRRWSRHHFFLRIAFAEEDAERRPDLRHNGGH